MLDVWETKILTIEHSNDLGPHHEEDFNCQAEQENNLSVHQSFKSVLQILIYQV